MYIAIIYFYNGTTKEHKFNKYPNDLDFKSAGFNMDEIGSYEVHF